MLAALTGVACLVAAAGEGWRFALMLRGRTWVLSGTAVRASDALLSWSSAAALLLAVGTAVWAIPNLVALHRGSAVRNGWAPARTGAAVVSRLVVPGWNVYGAGQIVAEIDGELAVTADLALTAEVGPARVAPPRPSVLVVVWWASWVLNALLALVTLVSAFWRSTQAMANTVEWHIALDLAAALVAGLFAAVLLRFESRWSGRIPDELAGWSVLPPATSAANRPSAMPAPDTRSAPDARSVAGTRSVPSEGQPQDGSVDGLEAVGSEQGSEGKHDPVDQQDPRPVG